MGKNNHQRQSPNKEVSQSYSPVATYLSKIANFSRANLDAHISEFEDSIYR